MSPPKNKKGAFVLCEIERGAFSGERVFQIALTDGGTYIGVAPRDYYFKADGSELSPDEPSATQLINGMLTIRIIKNGGKTAYIAIPDGEAVTVSSEKIICA